MDLIYNIILPEIRLNYDPRWAVDVLQTGNFVISISVCEERNYNTFLATWCQEHEILNFPNHSLLLSFI